MDSRETGSESEEIWPPPPEGSPPLPAPVRLKTGSVRGDALQGIGLNLMFFALCGMGLFLVPLFYFSERKAYPVYARWIGWTYVAVLMALGAAFYPYFSNVMFPWIHRIN